MDDTNIVAVIMATMLLEAIFYQASLGEREREKANLIKLSLTWIIVFRCVCVCGHIKADNGWKRLAFSKHPKIWYDTMFQSMEWKYWRSYIATDTTWVFYRKIFRYIVSSKLADIQRDISLAEQIYLDLRVIIYVAYCNDQGCITMKIVK